MKNKEVVIPILNNEYKVVVCWGDNNYVRKIVRKWGHNDADSDWENYRGQHFSTKGCHPVIVMYKPPKNAEFIGTLAHEAVHAIDGIFNTIGETVSGEVFAHSVGAIVRETLGDKE